MHHTLLFIFCVFLSALTPQVQAAEQRRSGPLHQTVILQYHHVADDTPRSTSVSPAVFAEHMAYLASEHTVISLEQALLALHTGLPLPDKSVVITFDDGYRNILTNAHPILRQYDFPYTVFINPSRINSAKQLSWLDIKMMQREGVTFANHSNTHLHMLQYLDGEQKQQQLARVLDDIEAAEKSLLAHLGVERKWLAYPYGEFDDDLQQLLARRGWLAFGQHSGAISAYSEMTALSRFPAAGPYSKMATLKTKLNSLAMPISARSWTDEKVVAQMPAEITLTLQADDVRLRQFACYFQGETLQVRQIDSNKVSVHLPTKFPFGRSRINCTAPSAQHKGRYYWYSQPFVRAKDGRYLD